MEATPEQAAEGLAIVQVLATVLDRLVTANTPLARTDPGQVTKFHAMKAPGIGILQYLERCGNKSMLRLCATTAVSHVVFRSIVSESSNMHRAPTNASSWH